MCLRRSSLGLACADIKLYCPLYHTHIHTHNIHTRALHRGGTCTLSPKSGVALSSTFTVACTTWSAEELPIRYSFGVGLMPPGSLSAPEIWYSVAGFASVGTFKLPEGNYTSAVRVYDAADSWSMSEKENFVVTQIVPKAGKSAESALLLSIQDMSSLGQSSNLLAASDSIMTTLDAETPGGRGAGGGRRLLASSQAYRLRVRRLLIKTLSKGSVAAEMSPESTKRTLASVNKLSSRPADVNPSALEDLSSLLVSGSANTLSDQVRTGGLQSVMSLSHNIIMSAELVLSGGARHSVVLSVKDSLQNVLDTFARSMTSDEAPLEIALSTSAIAVARDRADSTVYLSPDLQGASVIYEYGQASASQASSRRQTQSQKSGAGLAVVYFSTPWHPISSSLGMSCVIGVHVIVGAILPVPLPQPLILHKTRPCPTPGCFKAYVTMKIPPEVPLSRQNRTERDFVDFLRGLVCVSWQQGAWLSKDCTFVNATYIPANNSARILCACNSNGFVHAAWVPLPPYPLVTNTLTLRRGKCHGTIPLLYVCVLGGILALLSCIWFVLIVRFRFYRKYPRIRSTKMVIWAQDKRVIKMQRLWADNLHPELRPSHAVIIKQDEEGATASESDVVTPFGDNNTDDDDGNFWEHGSRGRGMGMGTGAARSVRLRLNRVHPAATPQRESPPHSSRSHLSNHQQHSVVGGGVPLGGGAIVGGSVTSPRQNGGTPRGGSAPISARSLRK
jgi:hypothetical protein